METRRVPLFAEHAVAKWHRGCVQSLIRSPPPRCEVRSTRSGGWIGGLSLFEKHSYAHGWCVCARGALIARCVCVPSRDHQAWRAARVRPIAKHCVLLACKRSLVIACSPLAGNQPVRQRNRAKRWVVKRHPITKDFASDLRSCGGGGERHRRSGPAAVQEDSGLTELPVGAGAWISRGDGMVYFVNLRLCCKFTTW